MKKRLCLSLSVGLSIWLVAGGIEQGNAADAGAELKTGELAEVLNVHWWIVQLPADLKQGDAVGSEFIDAEGKVIEGGGEFVLSLPQLPKSLRLFYKADGPKPSLLMRLSTGGSGGAGCQDRSGQATWALGNGALAKPGDLLMKFDASPHPSFEGGNGLHPQQVGLRVFVTRKTP